MAVAGLLVAGTNSDAGKSVVVTGLCRALTRRGLNVAPFKAQNMSNNSMVCQDGAEIGRAQFLQAQAAGKEPSSLHNPVLLKPGSDHQAFVVLRGQPAGQLRAGEYATERTHLATTAFATYEELASMVDLVICEGAGSPAEINLRAGDYVNMGLARKFQLPVLVIGDIDRGGILAALYGTWALLEPLDQALIKAFAINKFRGDQSVLDPGLSMVTGRTGVPFIGVIPWLTDVWLDSEDSLSVGKWRPRHDFENPTRRLSVAVIRFPRTSNATDIDALAAEPGVDVQVTTDVDTARNADLLILPGSRATVADLKWLRETGLASAVEQRAKSGRPILGICGGYQMLARAIHDPFESQAGHVTGLEILDVDVEFTADKVLGRPMTQWRGERVDGYEIHHGIVADDASFPGGTQRDCVWGTIWHGIFENDGFRHAWLTTVAEQAGSAWRPQAGVPSFADRRNAMIDRLADAVEEHLDIDQLISLSGAL